MPDTQNARSARFGRLVGAILITEGVLVAMIRLFSVVYVVASEAYNADRFRTPLSGFLPWVLTSGVLAFALVWAGSFFRRNPTGVWSAVGSAAKLDVLVAGFFNFIALYAAVSGLLRSPSSNEAAITLVVLGVTSVAVIAGLVHDVSRSRAGSERGTSG